VTEPAPRPSEGRRRRAIALRSATLDAAEPGRLELVVLLPSVDAATILLLCEAAAELTS
jgi:hypothetical protein